MSGVKKIAASGPNLLLVKDDNNVIYQLKCDPREKWMLEGGKQSITTAANYTTTQQFGSSQNVNSNKTGNHPTGL